MRTRVSKAFTLVEILIVVVILGILAAIVIPQFTNASQEAQVGNVQTQLQTLRSQIELFRVRNNGNPPVLVGGENASFPDFTATTNSFGADQQKYVRTPPVNPRNRRNQVASDGDPIATAAGAAATATGPGWYYCDVATNPNYGVIAAAGFDEVATSTTVGQWIP